MGLSRLVAASPVAACALSHWAGRLGAVAAVGGVGALLAVGPRRGCGYSAWSTWGSLRPSFYLSRSPCVGALPPC